MVLHTVKTACFIADGDIRAGGGARGKGETVGCGLHVVAVAHPCYAAVGQPLEQLAACVKKSLCFAVFTRAGIACGNDSAAQVMRDELAAVADAEHGNACVKERGINVRRLLEIYAVWAAGKDESDGFHGQKVGQRRGEGLYLAVNAALAHAAGDELIILPAKVEDDDRLVIHVHFSCRIVNSAMIAALFYHSFLCFSSAIVNKSTRS